MTSTRASVLGAGRARASTLGRASVANRGSILGRLSTFGGASGAVQIAGAPFDYVVCACAGLSSMQGVDSITCSEVFGKGKGGSDAKSLEDGHANSVDIASLHLIGIEDPLKVSVRGKNNTYHCNST